MSDKITFIHLGNRIDVEPTCGPVVRVPYVVIPQTAALYLARYTAIQAVETEYFSLLDGYDDHVLPEFDAAMIEVCAKLDETGLDIGSARESVDGRIGSFMHHAVVCRTAAFKAANFPEAGCYEFARLVYMHLARRGQVRHDVIAYDWVTTKAGAHRWPDINRAVRNTLEWLNNHAS